MNRYAALVQLTLARFREFYREPAAVFWVYGFPLILAVALGVAFRERPVERIRIDIVNDGSGGAALAEAWKLRLATDKKLEVTLHDRETCQKRFRTAKTDLVVTPVSVDGRSAPIPEYLSEPNRPESVLALGAVEVALIRSDHPEIPVHKVSTIEEPGARYIDFLIPGLIGLNLMGGGLFGIGFVIVDMRVRKLLKRFLATPMRKSDFLISLMLSRLLFMIVEMIFLVTFAYFAFGVKIQGNPVAFMSMILLGGMAFAGIGLLLACRAKTIETVSGMMNAVMLPMYVVSGVFFASDRFPEIVQPIIKALPLTALIDALRAIANEGAGFAEVAVPAATLATWGVVSFTLAMRWFRWN